MTILEMNHVSKAFGGSQALSDIHLSVEAGEIHALLGENGAGKSTLMNILTGVIPADAGTITFDGKSYPTPTIQQMETAGYDTKGGYMHLCPDCAGRMRQDVMMAAQQKKEKGENLVGGLVGALLGSIIGVVCIVIFGQMGRVAVASGIVMAVCTLKGYEMLGGKLTKKGIVIGVLMMLVMTYIGDRIGWAIIIVRELGGDIFSAFQMVPAFVQWGRIESANYWGNLVLLYVFTVIGAIPTCTSIVKDRKKEGEFGQIGSPRM